MAQCLLIVGDIALTIAYDPWEIEDGVEVCVHGGVRNGCDHLIQVMGTMGAIARTRCTEYDAMKLMAGFILTDDQEVTVQQLQALWYAVFPQEAFNP